jgi:hypothetical protein
MPDVRNRLFFDQILAKKPDFPLGRVVFAFVCHVHFFSLIYILTQFQEMSNSDRSITVLQADYVSVVCEIIEFLRGNGNALNKRSIEGAEVDVGGFQPLSMFQQA